MIVKINSYYITPESITGSPHKNRDIGRMLMDFKQFKINLRFINLMNQCLILMKHYNLIFNPNIDNHIDTLFRIIL
jgi:hypothetical protein